jgi:hypothetical protein
VVKNNDEWLESRKKLKKRKKRAAKDDPTGDEPAVFSFPMGDSRSRSSGCSTPPAGGGETHERAEDPARGRKVLGTLQTGSPSEAQHREDGIISQGRRSESGGRSWAFGPRLCELRRKTFHALR